LSDDREPYRYDPLLETQIQVAEEEKERRAAELAEEQNSPAARLAALEAELAEKVRLGWITRGDMVYELRRLDNALVVEITVEEAQRARDEEAAQYLPERGSDEPSEAQPETNAANEAAEDAPTERGEITEARAVRLARLRDITARLASESHENGNEYDSDRDPGDRSR
jgi:hypothetical protein